MEREYRSVVEQLNSLLQKSTDVDALRNELMHERMQIDRLRDELATANGGSSHDHSTDLRADIVRLETALHEARQLQRRAVSENEELHRIMQQNAEDENQNTIHVELQHALDRINALSTLNEQLQRTIDEMTIANRMTTTHLQQHNDDDDSVCSEHAERKG